MGGKLLEQLAQKENIFISDLKCVENQQFTLLILKSFSLDSYSVEEWNYVFEYIFDTTFSFQTYQEIMEFLNRHLKL